MRKSFSILAFALLAGCGGDKVTGPSMLQSVGNVMSGNSHSCDAPAPSGSVEQVACHKAAQITCGEETAPNRVDFDQPKTGRYAGQFLVKGYSCV